MLRLGGGDEGGSSRQGMLGPNAMFVTKSCGYSDDERWLYVEAVTAHYYVSPTL
jgi:hypothetical protein